MKLQYSHLQSVLKGTKTLKPGRHSDGRGLFLTVAKSGSMSWVFKWKENGVRHEMGLGSFTGRGSVVAVGLAEARLKADEARLKLSRGINPITEKQREKLTDTTFAAVLDMVIANETPRWKANADGDHNSEGEWKRSLVRDALPLIGREADEAKGIEAVPSMKVSRVDEAVVLKVLKPIWNTKATTADRIRYRIKAVIDLAIKKGMYTGENPATKENVEAHLGKQATKKAKKHPSLHYSKVPAFMAKLGRKGNAALGTAFTTLTCVRTDEARLMKRTEVDEEARLWIIPAERMKVLTDNDRGGDHVVPLSDAALELLRLVPKVEGNPYVFTGKDPGTPLGETAFNDKITKPVAKGGLNLKGEATMHGMRASFRTWVAEKKFNRDAAELCLAHKIGKDDTERSYNRAEMLEERAKILQAWADHCMGTNVVDLPVKVAA